jgi:hypothetical protein
LDEFEAFVFEPVLLGFQECALVGGGGFEGVEDLVEDAADLAGLCGGQGVGRVGRVDVFFDALGEDGAVKRPRFCAVLF